MIRVREIKVDVKVNNLLETLLKKLRIKEEDLLSYNINKRSIDARRKDQVYYIYEVDITLKNENKVRLDNNIFKIEKEEYKFIPSGIEKLNNKIIVVGSGPCGLFAAYELSKYGYPVIVLERGEDVDSRIKTVEKLWEKGELNKNSNVQFGEGGAGTFSDGKLSTGIKDKQNRIKEVLNIFVKNGAPEEILYDYMPHIGTNKLVDVVKNMRNKIISMGGEFRYNSCLTDININNGKLESIVINNNETLETNILILAIGHSARDTFRMLNNRKIDMINKPFAVGLRIMHPQSLIDKNQYGDYHKYLKPASYKLVYNDSNGRGVYSFCMCPGGYVVNASSEENRLVVNGMSNYERESGVANSAIVVTVNNKDYGDNLFDGVRFQEELESKAFNLGKGNIPIQKLGDYIKNIETKELGKFKPQLKGNYTFSNLNNLFSNEINIVIKNSISYFDNKIKGFKSEDAIFAGVESRTSSPIRIVRDEYFESNIKGIYPAGEGAGYAGGITSAAVDGIKIFEAIATKYESEI